MKNRFLIIIGLAVLTLAVFHQSLNNSFVSYDDLEYVIDNPNIKELSPGSVGNIFTSFYKSNYHPLTTLLYAVEYRLWGQEARGYHAVSLLLHLLNVLLLFWLVKLLSNKTGIAWVCAVLFAVHPMHVESVAWVSALKDVLYTAFFLAGLLAYVQYAKGGKKKKHLALCFFLFMLSVLCKPAAVIFPVVLVLIDYLLGRPLSIKQQLSKLPFFLLAVAFGIVAIIAQTAGGAMGPFTEDLTVFNRIFIAGYATLIYLIKVIIPYGLSAFHPFPPMSGGMLPALYYLPTLAFIALGWLLWRKRTRVSKEVIFGLLFFATAILPVLQLVPFGSAMLAERYTYVAYIGLFYIIGWSFSTMGATGSRFRPVMPLMLVVLVTGMGIFCLTGFQRVKVWKDSDALFSDIIKKYPDDSHGFMFRGDQHLKEQRFYDALVDYDTAVERDPANIMVRNNRAVAYFELKNYGGAMTDLNFVIGKKPGYARAWDNRATLKNTLGDINGALSDYNKLLKLEPDNGAALFMRAGVRYNLKDVEGCCDDLRRSDELGYQYAAVMMEEVCGN